MSDKPIQVGDLVVVTRPVRCRCKSVHGIGRIFKVVHLSVTKSVCSNCGEICTAEPFAWDTTVGDGHGAEIARLKRLDPDALKDDVTEDVGQHQHTIDELNA